MKLALITSYEILGPAQIERWNRLGDELSKQGTQLFLLSTNPSPLLRIPNMQIPYALREFNHLNLGNISFPGESNLVDIEEFWVRDFSRGDASTGLRKCRRFYQDVLDLLEPDVVGVWNTNLPQGRLLQLMCEERDLSVFTIEQGYLPGTLLLDRLRQNSGSELNNSFAFNSLAKKYVADPVLVDAYRSHYRQIKPAKYGKNESTDAQRKLINQKDKPLLLVLGQAYGGGILPRNNYFARQNFPGFDSYQKALTQLDSLSHEMQIGFRDHPINRLENSSIRVNDNVLQLNAGPLHEVVEQASVVVVLGATTALFEVLVLEKPLVVAGRTPISRFSPYVECLDESLCDKVGQARQGGFESIRAGADRALSFVLEHSLIAERDDVPSSHGLTDLADFLSDYDLGMQTPLHERFEKLEAWGKSV